MISAQGLGLLPPLRSGARNKGLNMSASSINVSYNHKKLYFTRYFTLGNNFSSVNTHILIKYWIIISEKQIC